MSLAVDDNALVTSLSSSDEETTISTTI